MDNWVADLLHQLDEGQAVDPQQLQQLVSYPEGLKQLRRYFGLRQLIGGWPRESLDLPQTEPVTLSIDQLNQYLEHGTLDDSQLDSQAQKTIEQFFSQSPQVPEVEGEYGSD